MLVASASSFNHSFCAESENLQKDYVIIWDPNNRRRVLKNIDEETTEDENMQAAENTGTNEALSKDQKVTAIDNARSAKRQSI